MINSNYIVVEKFIEPQTGEFSTVEVQDSFVYKGKVAELPETPVFLDNHKLEVGDIVSFAKYSPDTHEVTENGKTVKFVLASDVLKVYENN